MRASDIVVTTAPGLDGHRILKQLGLVRGIVVRSPGFARGLMGSLRSIFQGNITQFEEVCEVAREQATERMLRQAKELGANAVINMRYDATDFTQGITEVLAYGTAVQVQRE